MEETATLFDGESVPHEMTAVAGEAATVSMTRTPDERPEPEESLSNKGKDGAEIIELERRSTISRT